MMSMSRLNWFLEAAHTHTLGLSCPSWERKLEKPRLPAGRVCLKLRRAGVLSNAIPVKSMPRISQLLLTIYVYKTSNIWSCPWDTRKCLRYIMANIKVIQNMFALLEGAGG